MTKLDENGEKLLISIAERLSEGIKRVRILTEEQVLIIISLQKNIYLDSEGIWRIKGKKRQGGRLDIHSLSSRIFPEK